MLNAVKFAPGSDDIVEGLGIPFGGPINGKDLGGEYFHRGTNFALDLWPVRPVMYDHGLDAAVKLDVVGRNTNTDNELTDMGVWTRAQLDRRSKYLDHVKKLVSQGALGWSSAAPPHLVQYGKAGRIDQWPFAELTLTPIPANPDARAAYALKSATLLEHLTELGEDGEALMEQAEAGLKTATAVHHTGTSDSAWDAGPNETRADGEAALRALHAWYDPQGDPEAKGSYKFPHHFVATDGSVGDASTRAASSGIGVLNGGRGGASIPPADVQGVYRHLAGHLRDAEMTPPELKMASDAFGPIRYGDHLDRVVGQVVTRTDDVARWLAAERGMKVGRVLSAANRERLAQLRGQLHDLDAEIEELLTSTDPEAGKMANELMLARLMAVDIEAALA